MGFVSDRWLRRMLLTCCAVLLVRATLLLAHTPAVTERSVGFARCCPSPSNLAATLEAAVTPTRSSVLGDPLCSRCFRR